MASVLNQLSHAFLLLLLLLAASSSLRIHARESPFFTKTTRPEDAAARIPDETPAVKTGEPSNLPPARSLSGSGYGLYGRGQEQFTPTTTANYNSNNNNYNYNNNNNNNNVRPNANTFPSGFPVDAELTSENYEDKAEYVYGNQFNNANNNPSKFPTVDQFNTRNYKTNEYYNHNHNNNNNNNNNNYYAENEQQGMSDTRFLAKGKYFYDVEAERSQNRYETYPTRGNTEAGAMGYQNNYQGNQQESQENYVP